MSATALAACLVIGTFTGGAGWSILGGVMAVTGGFIGGKYGNAISQNISYGNVDCGVANLNGGFFALINFVSYTGLYKSAYNIITVFTTFFVDVVARKAVTDLTIEGNDLFISWKGSNDSLFVLDLESKELNQVELYKSTTHINGYSNLIIYSVLGLCVAATDYFVISPLLR